MTTPPVTLNSAQCSLINMLSSVTTEDDTRALRYVLTQFLNFKLQAEMGKLYANGTITPESVKEWSRLHLRTPYK